MKGCQEPMYNLTDLKKACQNPKKVISEANRFLTRISAIQKYNRHGIDIFSEDWDTLIILDACRYDFFVDNVSLPGSTESRISRGSTSSEFIRGNFSDKQMFDLVYVTANGWYLKLKDQINTSIHDCIFCREQYGDEEGYKITTPPSEVTECAFKALERYPNKRMIIHYLQPHQPFLGEYGRKAFEPQKDLLQTIEHNGATRRQVVKAYQENLDLVISEVERLLKKLSGKTVITSDHGELLGERQSPIPIRYFGHPEGVYVEELIKVPWHIINSGPRRDIEREAPNQNESGVHAQKIDEHLSALGYKF